MLQLHIWGPAFGLASFDAECLAAVAYCKVALPQGKWVLLASCDERGGQLPALYDEEREVWVCGFGRIVRYLGELDAEWDLDARLTPQQRADSTAFTSHIHLHLAPLVQLLLYCTPKNYAHTRHAISTLLPFPLPYFIPPRLHARAQEQTAHLNLSTSSSLDDNDDDTTTNPSTTPHTSTSPSTHLPPPQRQTLRTLLFATGAPDKIRLSAHFQHALLPLLSLLPSPSSTTLFSPPHTRPSSLDTLLFAHLALLATPDLPNAWGRALLALPRWDPLRTYCTRLRSSCGMFRPVTPATALAPNTATSPPPLPWRAYEGTSPAAVASRVGREVSASLPLAGAFTRRPVSEAGETQASLSLLLPAAALAAAAAVATAGVLGARGYLSPRYNPAEPLTLSSKHDGDGKGGMGEAGELLGSLGLATETDNTNDDASSGTGGRF